MAAVLWARSVFAEGVSAAAEIACAQPSFAPGHTLRARTCRPKPIKFVYELHIESTGQQLFR